MFNLGSKVTALSEPAINRSILASDIPVKTPLRP